MKIESSISEAKVLVFANTKIELDFKGKKQLSEIELFSTKNLF